MRVGGWVGGGGWRVENGEGRKAHLLLCVCKAKLEMQRESLAGSGLCRE